MLDHMTTRTKQWTLSLLASYPMVWLTLVYLFIIRARIHFGHWPSPSDGMAKYLNFASFHFSLAVYCLLASPLILLGVLALAVVWRWQDSTFRIWIPIATLFGSILLWCIVAFTDPGGFISWFVD